MTRPQNPLGASIEVSPRQAMEAADLPGLFPQGTRVYVTDLGTDETSAIVGGAERLRTLGYEPVPHFATRRLRDEALVIERLEGLTKNAGVKDVLVIGGGLDRPAGPFASSYELISTGLFERFGITEMGLAGHPEGSPDFSDEVALEALRTKKALCENQGIRPRIVTQFGFDGAAFAKWAENIAALGIDMPVHIGVAGPAKITSLIKFAMSCGVGNSVDFLKKRMGSIVGLVSNFSPDEVVVPIEERGAQQPACPIVQLHVFPFGGLKSSAQWLRERGSWAGPAA